MKMTCCTSMVPVILLLVSNTINTFISAKPMSILGKFQESSTAKIMRSAGYLAEDHLVKVQNGDYILNLVRVTNPLINEGRNGLQDKEPLLFVHGIFVNANSFILNNDGVKPQNYTDYDIDSMSISELQELLEDDAGSKSLVFTALNFGYEVWLLNRRPTLGSLLIKSSANGAHKLKEQTDLWTGANEIKQGTDSSDLEEIHRFAMSAVPNYYNFSLDEQCFHDIPETIDYVLSHSNKKSLTYVGHSAGSALFLMSLIARPELANKINKALLWAPALYLRGDFNRVVRDFLYLILPILTRLAVPITPPFLVVPFDHIVGTICGTQFTRLTICDPILDFILGAGNSQSMVSNFNAKNRFFDMISSHEGAQLLRSTFNGKMHRFGYSDEKQNILAYNQSEPPIYDMSKVRLETITVWSGITDIVVPKEDVEAICEDASVSIDHRMIGGPNVQFSHNSFYIHNDISNLLIIPSLKTIGTRG